MARPREFDVDTALDAAIAVFRDHGYEGSSAQMLVDAMGIGRQSLYNVFGDKWGIYTAALRRYALLEGKAHREALASGPRAIDGLRAMLDRVLADATCGCMGIGAIVEFAETRPDLVEIRKVAGAALQKALAETIARAQSEGDVDASLDPEELATFVIATVSGIRIAARGGASASHLHALVQLALRALR